MTNAKKKIIWAVDPFADDQTLQRSAAWAIKALTKNSDAIVQPIYFLNAYVLEGPFTVSRDVVRECQKDGQEQLDCILRRIKINGIRPLHVFAGTTLTKRECAAKVTELALRWRADMTVISTHASKGMRRLYLGSFAETLLLYSEIPLFCVNPLWNQVSNFENILFPTDFSDESKEVFPKVLALAKSLKSKITVFHKIKPLNMPRSYTPNYYSPYRSEWFYQEFIEQNKQMVESQVAKWKSRAMAEGVALSTYVDESFQGSVTDSILAHVKKRPSLIAMASHSGPARAAILGSTTRKIVRLSSEPVWVIHPKLKKTRLRNVDQIAA